jgi:amino acid adenylation domain-containing protein
VVERDVSRSPLFQVMFSLQNTPDAPALRLGELELSGEGSERRTAQFELSFLLQERPSGLNLAVEYCTDLFDEGTIERMGGHYAELLQSVVRDAGERVCLLQMLTTGEEQQLLVDFNDTKAEYPRDKTVVELFEEQAARTPESVAVVYEGEWLTYGELDRRSNQLGHYLRGLGVKEDMPVAICMERGIELIVGILGIMKAGGAYVPIDPAYPEERIAFMVEDTGSDLVVTGETCREAIRTMEVGSVPRSLKPEHLAYVIYTSGSTGRPKGSKVFHSGVSNLLHWYIREFALTDADKNLIISSIGFDLSQKNILGTLLAGGLLVLPPMKYYDTAEIGRYIEEMGVTIINCAPSAFYPLAEAFHSSGKLDSLRLLILGGEPINYGYLSRWLANRGDKCQVVNNYGPTECTDIACFYRLRDFEKYNRNSVPIGRPNSNVQVYILGGPGQLQPIGVVGEIGIAGAGVGGGYVRDEKLTRSKFVENPFGEGQLYRTGDMGRWLADGNIEFVGRKDDQVKIRGYRIELGEVEGVLRQCPGVSQGVVVAQEEGGAARRLVGYVVTGDMDREGIERYLEKRLPEYMVPRQWVKLEALPLTPNGKVDRKSLPEPGAASALYEEPRYATEAVLARAWEELLGVGRVGINDNFFALGGHSIKIVQLLNRLKTSGYQLELIDLFANQTIQQQAKWLDRDQAARKNDLADGHLLFLKQGSTHSNLFLVPGEDGSTGYMARNMAKIESLHSIYGLEMLGLRKEEKPLATIREIAAQNIQWIRQVQPYGPYILIGHSFGVYVVYEMIKQLEEQNEVVAWAALLDTATENLFADYRDTIMTILFRQLEFWNVIKKDAYPQWAIGWKKELEGATEDELYATAVRLVTERFGNYTIDMDGWLRNFYLRVVNGMIYRPPTGNVKAQLLVVKAEHSNFPLSPADMGWAQHAKNITVMNVKGGHNDLMVDHLDKLVAEADRYLLSHFSYCDIGFFTKSVC